MNNEIRKLTPVGTNWVVTTLAGGQGAFFSGNITNTFVLTNIGGGMTDLLRLHQRLLRPDQFLASSSQTSARPQHQHLRRSLQPCVRRHQRPVRHRPDRRHAHCHQPDDKRFHHHQRRLQPRWTCRSRPVFKSLGYRPGQFRKSLCGGSRQQHHPPAHTGRHSVHLRRLANHQRFHRWHGRRRAFSSSLRSER